MTDCKLFLLKVIVVITLELSQECVCGDGYIGI